LRVSKTVSLKEFSIELSLLPQQLTDAADKALNLSRALGLARAYCPVKIGALRETIRVERTGPDSAKLAAGDTSVRYAGYVHDGTSRIPPRPFIAQALAAERDNIAQEILLRAAGVI